MIAESKKIGIINTESKITGSNDGDIQSDRPDIFYHDDHVHSIAAKTGFGDNDPGIVKGIDISQNSLVVSKHGRVHPLPFFEQEITPDHILPGVPVHAV